MKKLSLAQVLSEGISIGAKNSLSLLCTIILWLFTIWIPYLNVGTTIAICSIPVELSKKGSISPLFIFEAKYRQYMGEFFTLISLILIALIPAILCFVLPAFVITLSWSLAIYIMVDKGTTPTKAMTLSNKATMGHKWTIFLIGFIIAMAILFLGYLFEITPIVGPILTALLFFSAMVTQIGCSTVFYRELYLNNERNEIEKDKDM